jgi:ubiquinone/menaquinone biosynthesis C-methylase UbiE
MHRLIPSQETFERQVPAAYRQYAGIGPYYFPIFGWIYRRRLTDCVRAVLRHCSAPTTVLDAGCGFGLATAALARNYPRARVLGLDAYPSDVLDHAKTLMPGSGRVQFLSGSVEHMPFANAAFDLVTAFDVLEHVRHPEVALRECDRILASSGLIVISVPIESPLLRIARYVVLFGGMRGEIKPHWEGSFRNLKEFEHTWVKMFEPLEIFNTPFRHGPRFMNYDVVYVGRKLAI